MSTPESPQTEPDEQQFWRRDNTEVNLLALGGLVHQARNGRGLSVEAMSAEAGVGHMTWRRVEEGASVRASTYTALERVFGLSAGQIQRALSDSKLMVKVGEKLGFDATEVNEGRQWASDWLFGFAAVGTQRKRAQARVETAPPPSAARPSLVAAVGEVTTRLAGLRNRTPAAEEALAALLRLMPELADLDDD